MGDKQRENVGAQLMSTGFVGGISIPSDCARTRSQWRQVKRRVVIDPPSRTKYYTGCPYNTVVTSPTSSGYQPRPPKPMSSSRSVLRSRLSRAGPREHRPARCTPPPGDLKIRRCAHRSGAESLSKQDEAGPPRGIYRMAPAMGPPPHAPRTRARPLPVTRSAHKRAALTRRPSPLGHPRARYHPRAHALRPRAGLPHWPSSSKGHPSCAHVRRAHALAHLRALPAHMR